jgi:MFS family permease
VSFKAFIYYCALCGGWAAFLAWAIVVILGVTAAEERPVTRSVAIAAILGLCVAAAVGLMDALLNAVGTQRLTRVLLCSLLGLVGGALGGLIGGFAVKQAGIPLLTLPGWLLVGALVGGSVGTFDVLRAIGAGEDLKAANRKLINGVLGGLLGGFLGGLPFTLIYSSQFLSDHLPHSRLTLGLVLLGLCIGLMIGLAQVMLKQAWLRVEEGFRAGRELLLTKDVTTIGRAESCDLGLFGDSTIEKVHARIVLKDRRYLVVHVAEGGETLLNDQPISTRPVALVAGDRIQIGRSVLLFGEREKRRR